MSEPEQNEIAEAPPDSSPDFNALIDSLHKTGAERFDPVRLHYIDVLARRAVTHQGSVRRMLEARLTQAITAFKERFDLARRNAQQSMVQSVQQFPHAADELRQHFDAGGFKQLRQVIAAPKADEACAPLTLLSLDQDDKEKQGISKKRPVTRAAKN